MFRFLKYYLESEDTQSIALPQSITQYKPLLLNGRLGNGIENSAVISKKGFSYYVSLTSNADLSTYTFTISGYYNNNFTQVTLAGPNNSTVNTFDGNLVGADEGTPPLDILFDRVTSITSDESANLDAIEVGTTIGVNSLSNPPLYGIVYSKPILVDSVRRKTINGVVTIKENFPTGTTAYGANFSCDYQIFASVENIIDNGRSMTSMIADYTLVPYYPVITATDPILLIRESFQSLILRVEIPQAAPITASPNTILSFSQET